MKLLDLLNYVIAAVVLLAIGWVVKKADLLSFYSNQSMPNFCSVMALSVMIVALTALILQKPVSEIPGWAGAVVCAGFVLFVGILIFANSWKNLGSQLFFISMAEWLGASAILISAFVLPRLKQK
jgi:uncharacterized membrane protein YgdD (TMEM256/DUF423 family)